MKNGTYAVSYDFNYINPALPSEAGKIILVGTAHVSDKSVAEVNEIIEREHPDIIAVELCRGRYQALKGENEVKEINLKEMLKDGKFYYFLIHWLLGYVQKKIGADTGVKPGSEMIAAIDIAERTGAKVALIDRDIQVTLGRFWNKMSFFEKLKLFASLMGASVGIGTKDIDIDTVTDEDVVTQLVSELRKLAPTAASVLLDERDIFMARNLVDISKDGKVVAVVGAGHREGIQRYLDNPETIPPIDELATIPKKGFSWINAILIATLVMILGVLALLVFSGGVSLWTLLTAMLYLFVTQGVLSGLGVLAARGHPISALTAFGLAWFGFLHPFLAVGWLAGLVEAHFRPPTTDDVRNIMKDELLFNWDEIPGKENTKLIDFLVNDYGAKWVKNATIEKTDNGNTISITSDNGVLFLKLNDKSDNVNVLADEVIIYKFTVEHENNRLNVYRPKTLNDMMRNKLFRIILVAGLANLGSMLGTFVAIPIMVDYLNIPNPLEILKTALDTGLGVLGL